jgi:diguanylate cyclase (GGDEF)-like protein
VAERIRRNLEQLHWPQHPDLVVTASFGVADLASIDSPEPAALVAAADQALYAAKRAGRNCVIQFENASVERARIAI